MELKKKRQKGALDDFYNHVCKQQKALLILPKDIEIIYQEFKEPDFDSKCFETKAILIDQDLRERFTFIDYGDTGWIDPPKVNKKLLEKFIDEVETHCKKHSI